MTVLKVLLSALTFFIVVINRRTIGGHLLDLPPGLFGGLECPQLVLLLADPGGGEASVILWQAGGGRWGQGCRQSRSSQTKQQAHCLKAESHIKPHSVTLTKHFDIPLTCLSFLRLRRCGFCWISFWPIGVGHVDKPHHCGWGGGERTVMLKVNKTNFASRIPRIEEIEESPAHCPLLATNFIKWTTLFVQ